MPIKSLESVSTSSARRYCALIIRMSAGSHTAEYRDIDFDLLHQIHVTNQSQTTQVLTKGLN